MALGREAQPRAGIIDSQRVKTTGVGGERGDGGATQSKGRKRHRLVDTQSLVRTVTVHPADVRDCDGIGLLWPPAHMQAASPAAPTSGLRRVITAKIKGVALVLGDTRKLAVGFLHEDIEHGAVDWLVAV